ncbi:MAG: hypothetical protein EOM54_02925 [Clostridia bacterium]|nr:hypothetical protein [Clostridia bacterium]
MTLFPACALTVVIETAFLALCGFRSRAFLAICVLVNIATNLLLNISLYPLSNIVDITYFIYVLEAMVVAAEYMVYALIEGRSRLLFLLTLAANALSYGTGILIYGHI